MKREIIANVLPEETRIAVLDRRPPGRVHDRAARARHGEAGGQHLQGQTGKRSPGISSAFVNTGFEKNAYLYVTDVVSPPKTATLKK
jgi:ribonuclease G